MELTSKDIELGYWYHRPEEDRPPKTINYPHEYTSGDRLSVVCTQLAIGSCQQRKLVEEWCRFLPGLETVSHLWLQSKVPQSLFDAACQMANLESLYVKWSGIKTIRYLPEAPQLKALHIGSSPGIEDVERFAELDNLVVLGLENVKQLKDLRVIAELTQLQGLAIEGSLWTTYIVESLAPLTALQNLKYLFLTNLRSLDRTLKPLAALKSLETLRTAWWWPRSEFRMLRESLPNLRHGNPLKDKDMEQYAKKG